MYSYTDRREEGQDGILAPESQGTTKTGRKKEQAPSRGSSLGKSEDAEDDDYDL